ncbi:hypothetical protein GCM10007036_11690 [Alsobacter metallidurans]|uniref:O-antigen ligase-like membrane protein n=1 Tax=Alsobacter metallidurans TaxID=340221 RepID=A0A917I650_9HYPH|nr:O-antigen ligase family protein [Alsobacter metallidurans]GGH13250.1 hypothetical protein GCM10007036_11690 [Alsobacter metallidurans]
MTIEIFGAVAILLGIYCTLNGPDWTFQVFLVCTLLQATAAISLPALGGANIQPGHVLLGFVILAVVTRPQYAKGIGNIIEPGREGFWLLLTVVYGVVSAYFMPRLFAGQTLVFTVDRNSPVPLASPLGPVSGNITQTVYFVGSAMCFLATYAFASGSGAALTVLIRAGVACAMLNLFFGAADLVTYWTGTSYIMDVLRTAQYSMLNETTIAGFKRIVGSFSEAGAYAFFTLGLLGFSLRLWLGGVMVRATGPISLLSILALTMSTSTTAYAGLPLYLVAAFGLSLLRFLRGPVPPRTIIFLFLSPIILCVIVIPLILNDTVWAVIQQVARITVFEKMTSDSGVERGNWNRQAITNFIETFGFGAGLGSIRSSSFLAAVPSNLGVFGTLTYTIFLVQILLKKKVGEEGSLSYEFRAAAAHGCIGLFIAACLVGGFVDLGLMFFTLAGIAASRPAELRSSRTSTLDRDQLTVRALRVSRSAS